LFRHDLEHLPVPDIERLMFRNAAELYHHPLPPAALLDAALIRRPTTR
jgi:hypothetical protein